MRAISKLDTKKISGGNDCAAQICEILLEINQSSSPKILFIKNKDKYLEFSKGPCGNYKLETTYVDSDNRHVIRSTKYDFDKLADEPLVNSIPEYLFNETMTKMKEDYALYCKS